MDNTGAYLKKEVISVEGKISEAKYSMKKSLGFDIEDMDAVDDVLD